MSSLIATAAFGGAAYAAGPDEVQRQGTFHLDAGDLSLDTTIRVTANDRTPGVGTDANGKIWVTDNFAHTHGISTTRTAEARTACANVDGNRATVIQGSENTTGRIILIKINDNGDGQNPLPDTAAFGFGGQGMTPEEAVAAGFCHPYSAGGFPINSGNFTVRNRS
ncbi:hypothetical protein [Kocuria rosea]|uniref:hypothetical protein n=1 Tax=Kocuria rosea TaxID=1275 RepID=UPI0025406342|nr:hypothetical protein [Kocuria rosea]WIG17598.1 hypothetical protein QOY29_01320 [Kocuria rosea]